MVLALLKRYLDMYWLKPFDAVGDTANAVALRRCSWPEPVLELGGGDGVFSFIMHGGAFDPAADRFDQADPGRKDDIFDVYQDSTAPGVRRPASRTYVAGVDLKWSHLAKARRTTLYRSLVMATPDQLPFASGSFRTVFLYFPHGLVERGGRLEYEPALREVRRVLQPEGTLLMTAFNARVRGAFVCHALQTGCQYLGWPTLAAYFARLDAGRYAEIAGLARTRSEWEATIGAVGFRLVETWTHIRPTLWTLYDVQTRPILRRLIRLSAALKSWGIKGHVKRVWVYAWLPFIGLAYLVLGRPRRLRGADDQGQLLLVFRATAVSGTTIR